MAFAIHTRDARTRLDIRAKPYFVRLSDGLHLGYRKGKAVSRWVVRTRHARGYHMRTVAGIEPDDKQVADGVRVMNYQQMAQQIMLDKNIRGNVACSFCGKTSRAVAKLIAGPGVFICDACVQLCQLYLEHDSEGDTKLLVEDGKAVMQDGKPVFVPLSESEIAQRDRLIADHRD